MKLTCAKWIGRSIALLVITCTATGCSPSLFFTSAVALTSGSFLFSNFAAFTSGWILRDMTTSATTDTQCFRNGVLIDCSDISQ